MSDVNEPVCTLPIGASELLAVRLSGVMAQLIFVAPDFETVGGKQVVAKIMLPMCALSDAVTKINNCCRVGSIICERDDAEPLRLVDPKGNC